MPRQLLTILVVFLLVTFAMRSCASSPSLPPVVITESEPAAESETFTLGDVVLALDGSVVSIGADVVRPVSSSRRTFQLFVRLDGGEKRVIPAGKWTHAEVDGGSEFTYVEDDLRITKRLTAAADGHGLALHLTMTGAPEYVEGLYVVVLSGVPLPAPGSAAQGGLFGRLSTADPGFKTFAGLVQDREAWRKILLKRQRDGEEIEENPVYYRTMPDTGHSLGVLGAAHYVVLEQHKAARRVSIDVYRIEEANQIEAWVTLDALNGTYTGEFSLRWGARKDIGSVDASLQKHVETQIAKIHRIENDTMRVEFSDLGASIRSLWLKKFSLEAGLPLTEENWVPLIFDAVPLRHRALSIYANPDKYGSDLTAEVWQAVPAADGKSIKFTLKTGEGYVFEKVIRLPEEDRYDLGVTVNVERPEGSGETSVNYTLTGPAGSFINDSYRGIIGAEPPSGLLIEREGGDSDDESIEALAKEEPLVHKYETDFAQGYLRAVLVRGAFFACGIVTEEREDSMGRSAGHVIEARVNYLELTRAVDRSDGESSRQSLKGQITCAVPIRDGVAVSEYHLYAGPNRRSDLKPLLIQEAVDFGFFGGIGRMLMWLMKFLQGLLGSYGLAIMFMTLIVRALLMPVSYRTQLGMMRYSKRIQKIKPELEKLEKQYGKNKQKLNQERMRVMRENKVGFPLGCLMIFFQIPIWFALFGALRVEFSLRHQPFLWATDLTMPDALFGLPFWPHTFNLLPVLMLVLWVAQQRLAPTAGSDDPQVRAQMKMVRFMPYVFFIFLYKYAAALSVYMCVSSAWGIMEAKIVRNAVKQSEDGEGNVGPAVPAK